MSGNDDRYVVVAIDKVTGDIYIDQSMLKESYPKLVAEDVIACLPDGLKNLKDFLILHQTKALSLQVLLNSEEHRDQTKKIIN